MSSIWPGVPAARGEVRWTMAIKHLGARMRLLCAGAIATLGFALLPASASAGGTTLVEGTTTEASGLTAFYKIEVPSPWNGTLVLYSHGYSFSATASADDVSDAGDPVTRAWLLANGYALAASGYATSGWALQQAFEDQIAVLDVFATKFGQPKRTIAWGHSLGGMITASLVQLHPNRFTAALPMCGVVAGGPGVWNQGLDASFAFETLQAPGAFKIVDFTPADVVANYTLASTAFNAAQATPAGRARIALSAALGDTPGWFDQKTAEPAATDYAAQEANQLTWDNVDGLPFGYFGRLELEIRAGGNFSWNTGVDYRKQLARSTNRAEVKALYAAAGLDLEKDLDTLNDAPRISANPHAVAYLTKYITFNGDLDMPVLTLHTTGDGLVEVTDEQAYASVVSSAGDSSLLRQVFVHRAGHCTFTPAETVSAFQTLVHRVDTGRWQGTDPTTMNARAAALGPAFNFLLVSPFPPGGPSFIHFRPGQFLRPFDARNVEDQGGGGDNGGGDSGQQN